MKSVSIRRTFSLPIIFDRARIRVATMRSLIWPERLDERINLLFSEFQTNNREWVEKGVNQTLFEERIMPLIDLYRQYRRWPTALEIALEWDEAYGSGNLIDRKLEVTRLAHALTPFVDRIKQW